MFRKVRFSLAHLEEDPKLFTLFFQDWVAVAEQIDCPAPLPEDPESELLTKMLFPASYEVPEKKAKKEATGTRKGLRRRAVIDSSSEDPKAQPSHDDEEEEEESPPPHTGEEKKRKASPQGEDRTPKKGKTSRPDYSTTAAYIDEEWLPRAKPLAKL